MKVVSWDGLGLNGSNYQTLLDASTYGQSVNMQMALRQGDWPRIAGVERPGKVLILRIFIRGATNPVSLDLLQKNLFQFFDPDDETPKQLRAEDDAGGNDRYIMGICEALEEVPFSAGLEYIAAIRIDGDIRWRAFTPTTESSWNITATAQSRSMTTSSADEANAFPVIEITPTNPKTSSWPYKRFMAVKWRIASAASNYPVDIANDSLDTQIASTNFAQADGDDLWVYVDGVLVSRWLDGINTSTTKVWVNLDWVADVPMTLDGGIGAADTSLIVNEAITNLPTSGIIQIDSEIITWTSKSNSAKTLYGLTRGAKGSTAATHSTAATVYWLQHDIEIIYGNATTAAPTVNNNYKPMFELASSTNTSWDYNDFNDIDGPYFPVVHPRSGRWSMGFTTPSMIYTATEGGTADPASVIGLHPPSINAYAKMYVDNPCGITAANFVNGKKRTDDITEWSGGSGGSTPAYIYSDLSIEYYVTAPTINDTFQTWSRNETLATGATRVGLFAQPDFFYEIYLEASDVTLTLNSSNTPTVTIGAETNNYSLDCQLYNASTGQRINVTFNMEEDETLQIDTYNKTVTYLADNTKQARALEIVDGPRRDWFYFRPNTNLIYYYETGVTGMTIDIEFEKRYYH